MLIVVQGLNQMEAAPAFSETRADGKLRIFSELRIHPSGPAAFGFRTHFQISPVLRDAAFGLWSFVLGTYL